MGLLDTLMNGTGDAERDNAMYRGILAAGLQLMQAKGRGLFPALGQAGMTGLGAADQYTQQRQAAQMRDQQRQMAALQLQNAQREQQIAQLPGRFMAPGGGQAVDATGGMDTAAENPNNVARPEGQFDEQGYLNALRGMDFNRYLQTAAAMRKEKPALINVPAGGAVYDPGAGKEVYRAPFKPAEQSKPSALQEYEYAVSQGYKGTFDQWDLARKKAGATNLSVNTEKPLMNELATGLGKQIDTSLGQAKAATGAIQTAHTLKGAIDSGKIIAGPGASFRVLGLQVGQMMGINGKNGAEVLSNTRAAIQAMAQSELDAAQQMKGQGQITEAERDIIRRAASGNIDGMTAPEIRLLADAMEKTARSKIKAHQKNVESLGKMPNAGPLLPFYQIEEPPTYQSPGMVDIGGGFKLKK